MAVVDLCCDITFDWFGFIDTASKEVVNICIVNLPTHIAVYLFQRRSCSLHEVSTADVALSIICSDCSIGIIGSSEVKTFIFTSCYRDRNVRRGLTTITMGAHTEFLNPYVTA